MKLLITAGPTREPIDAVRFISNRSSGKLGVALLDAAAELGHEATLLMGPGIERIDPPARCRVYRFESSAELAQLLEAHFNDHDVLIMAAAVADYRPICVNEGKLERAEKGTMTLTLQPTPDLVARTAANKRPGQRIIAFALEEAAKLRERATAKMKRKGVDAIVANPLGTMESDSITPTLFTADGQEDSPGRMSKRDFARWLVDKAQGLLSHG